MLDQKVNLTVFIDIDERHELRRGSCQISKLPHVFHKSKFGWAVILIFAERICVDLCHGGPVWFLSSGDDLRVAIRVQVSDSEPAWDPWHSLCQGQAALTLHDKGFAGRCL